MFEDWPQDIVRQFMAHGPCGFATAMAKEKDGILWTTISGRLDAEGVDDLNGFLDDAAEQSKVAIVVFRSLRTPRDVAELIATLCQNERWQAKSRAWGDLHPREDDLLIWLRWATGNKELTSVMGLAAIDTMPVHRRAPFVSLVLWPGARENAFENEKQRRDGKKKSATLGFFDVKLPEKIAGASEKAYDAMVENTTEASTCLKEDPPEGSARYDVTFCLPTAMGDIALRISR